MLSEMKEYKNWVAYRLEAVEGKDKPRKIPVNPNTGRGAMANNPATWGTYAAAVNFATNARAQGLQCGIGFEFSNSPFAGIDLDDCIDDNGNLAGWARDIVEIMNSYTEYSPSGDGLHILFKGEILPELVEAGKQGTKAGNIEIYYGLHFFTVTKKTYGEAKPIIDASESAEKVFRKYFIKTFPPTVEGIKDTGAVQKSGDLLEIMFSNPKNGNEIRRLYDGDITGYYSTHKDGKTYPDPSAADLALCNHLAYYTHNNAGEIDRLFRASGLMRPKWDENHGGKTYGEMTIEKAIAGTAANYEPYERTEIYKQAANENDDDFDREAVSYYLNDFLQEIKKNREGQAISTGFEHLDKMFDGGLYPGLYFIGANSSLGKTALTMQIADNVAQSKRGVLVFSLEMSRNELIARTLSRMTFLKSVAEHGNSHFAKTTRGILTGKYNATEADLIQRSLKEYEEWGHYLHISEGIGNIGIEHIKNKVLNYIEHTGTPPVIVIDYIQILAPYDLKMTDKQNVDKNVLELKRLSRDFQIPVIGISSFNRENYKTPVSMASFKESGAIEYSSDILIGAQYYGWDYQEKEKEPERLMRLNNIREVMNIAAKSGKSQLIQVKILKNRNGVRGDVLFDFYPKFNYFISKEIMNA